MGAKADKSKLAGARRLHSGHFAFMRGLVQGLDMRQGWERYLGTEGDVTDLRRVKSTIAWIRESFAAAARRHDKPGTARLIAMDAAQIAGKALPNVDEYVASEEMEDFSQVEQLEAFLATYPDAVDRRTVRRARLVERQLDALRWLEALVAQKPGPLDAVAAWFPPTLADRLHARGVLTLDELVQRIDSLGARWWSSIGGVGQVKANRIVEWLREHEATIGRSTERHTLTRRASLSAKRLTALSTRKTDVVAFEKFLLPAELDGRAGVYRAPPPCLLGANNDYEALEAWLATKHDPNKTGKTATHRAYRKEAERLLLWSILEHKKPLSSLNVQDVQAFISFLAAPPARWCARVHHPRWSAHWRPLEAPLSRMAQRQTIVILRSLFAYLTAQSYLIGNAFAGVPLPRDEGRPLGSQRTLSFRQWDALETRLDAFAQDPKTRRQARTVRWLYATGLRLSEMANAKCGDLQKVDYRHPDGSNRVGWLLHVVGKGDKPRDVPVPAQLVQELDAELGRQGLKASCRTSQNDGVAILFRVEKGQAKTMSMSGLAKSLKALLAKIAPELEEEDAEQLRKASTHWFRHTHGSHALNGRPGKSGVPVQVVQNNLGHASLGTTSLYLNTERDQRLAAMSEFGLASVTPDA